MELRIGPLRVQVVESELLMDELGKADLDGCRILLRPGLPPSLRYETLLHEVLHFVARLTDTEGKLNDKLIGRVSPLLAQVLTDNLLLGGRYG